MITDQLTITTPTLLFSAISLILLAYTNRFLGYAALVRDLHARSLSNPTDNYKQQIDNLKRRLYLIRSMQVFGVTSLFLCVITMFLVYIDLKLVATYIFAVALISLIISLAISVKEILISVKALEFHLSNIENRNR